MEMRAVQVVAPGKAEFVKTPKPALKPGHALMRTLLLSLCGSDVHMLHFAPPEEYPLQVGTTGHEVIAVVEAIDAPESGIHVGDVALTLTPPQNGMVEYYVAPVEDIMVLPEGMPLEHGLMAQQLGTVIFACKRLPNIMGRDAVVIGQGSAGLHFNAMLRRMGAERVIGLDVVDARVAAGLKFGATHTFNNAKVDALEAVQEVTDGKLAGVVIEAAGEVDSINLAPHLVQLGGNLLFFGVPRATDFDFDFWTMFRTYCYTTTSGASAFEPGRTSFKMALDLIARGVIDVSPMLTHRLEFDQVMDAYELARTRDDGVIKVIIEMPGYQR
jgi:threonine dehydrogenase-like Zn-dependent dehydrogenase